MTLRFEQFRGRENLVTEQESKGDLGLIEAVSDHIERHIGKIDIVMHEIVSSKVHIDVHVVRATRQRPYQTLVTSGMAELPMRTPTEPEDARLAELMICLPRDWPIDIESFKKDENVWWPIRLLKTTAYYPHEDGTWIYRGHTIANGENEPYAPGTRMSSVVLIDPRTVTTEGHIIKLEKRGQARLWALVPLYKEELALKLSKGFGRLEYLLDRRGVNEVLDPKRANVSSRWRLT
jgi:hypothetical protein